MSQLVEGLQALSLGATRLEKPGEDGFDEGSHPETAAMQHVVAGGGDAMAALRELIVWPQLYAGEAAQLGVVWPRGLLLHGPPGCGKTLMVRAVAEECGAALHTVTAGDVYGAFVGQSERRLREAFEAAGRDAAQGRVAVVFLDEVDALCPRRDGQRAHESRVVAQLLTLMDGAGSSASGNALRQQQQQPTTKSRAGVVSLKGHLVVVGATNRPAALDPALRRPGRLDREVSVSVPNAQQREAILRSHTQGLQLHPELDMSELAGACHGYSGADLAALAREATLVALAAAAGLDGNSDGIQAHDRAVGLAGPNRAPGMPSPSQTPDCGVNLASLSQAPGGNAGLSSQAFDLVPAVVVCGAHFSAAMRRVGPSIVRGVEVEVPRASWDDIGGLSDVKRRLQQCVEWPLRHGASFACLGLSPPRGVLLYGVPGTSKTSLARAAAAASGATLLPLSCAQLFSMYVGEGEALLRDVFRRARLAAPSIVLLDEVDAVAARRAEGGDSGGGEAGVRLLTTLLTEMDGMEEAQGVLVLGTTNRPDAVDAALMRPGRFDTLLHVPPPDMEGRLQVLRVHTRGMPLASDVDLSVLARETQGFTGAELAGLCREAALSALREDLDNAQHVALRHFQEAKAAGRAPAQSPLSVAALANWAGNRRARTA